VYTTIQEAVDNADDGAIIILADCNGNPDIDCDISSNSNLHYAGGIELTGKNLTIASEYFLDGNEDHIGKVIINGGNNSPAILYSATPTGAGCELVGFTIFNGNDEDGGGLRLSEVNMVLSNMVITENNGSGIYIANCEQISIVDSDINNNISANGGGIHILSNNYPDPNNTVEILNSTIQDNLANGETINGLGGGGILIEGQYTGTIKIGDINKSVQITGNNTLKNGGGICITNTYDSEIFIIECDISNNNNDNGIIGDSGGGIASFNASPNIISTSIVGNHSRFPGTEVNHGGGGLLFFLSSSFVPSIANCTIEDNMSGSRGGGICAYGDWSGGDDPADVFVIDNTTINGNYAAMYGGGIFLQKCANLITDSSINTNSARSGGGIYGFNTYLSIGAPLGDNSYISDNTGAEDGGGIYITAPAGSISNLFLTSTEVSDNTIESLNTGSKGGGVYSFLTSTYINESVIRNNQILLWDGNEFEENYEANGGGIYIELTEDPQISHSIVSSNIGGGIYFTGALSDDPVGPVLQNIILNDNIADNASGVYIAGSNITSENLTVTENENLEGIGAGTIEVCGGSFFSTESSILWNTIDESSEIYIADDGCEVEIYYSDVSGGESDGITGFTSSLTQYVGCINEDPAFRYDPVFPYLLSCGSLCIDAGNPDHDDDGITWESDVDDQESDGSRIDQGAYGGLNTWDWMDEYILGCTDGFADNPDSYAEIDDCSCDCGTMEGDVNNDGTTDVLDIVQIVNFIMAGQIGFTECQFYQADMNVDNDVDIVDVVQIVSIILNGSRESYPNGSVMLTNTIQQVNQDSSYIDLWAANETIVEGIQIEFRTDSLYARAIGIEAGDYISDMTFSSRISDDSTTVKILVYDADGGYLDTSQYGKLARVWLTATQATDPDSSIFTERLFVNMGNDGQYLPDSYGSFTDYQAFVCDMDSSYCFGCKDVTALNHDPVALYEDSDQCVYLLGDMDGDSDLNVADCVMLADIIIGKIRPSAYQEFAGDMNGDEQIDNPDLQKLINIILDRGGEGLEPGTVVVTKTIKNNTPYPPYVMEVSMSNSEIVRGVQLDILMDPGYKAVEVSQGPYASELTLAYNIVEEKDSTEVRLLLYSADGSEIDIGNGRIADIGLEWVGLNRNIFRSTDCSFIKVNAANSGTDASTPEIVEYAEFIRRVGSSEEPVIIPEQFVLHPAYPNPFNPVTTIRYDLPRDSDVTLVIYDIMGRVVEGLIDDYINAGYHRIQWDASGYSSGIYLIKLLTPGYTTTQKVLLLK